MERSANPERSNPAAHQRRPGVVPAVLRCAGYHPEHTIYTRAFRALEAELTRDDGLLRVEVTPSIPALGHKASDLLGMVARGDYDLCYFNTSYLAGDIPGLRVFDLPFLITNRAEIYRKLDGGLGTLLAAEVERRGDYRVLGFWDNGFRHISNRVRPITRVQDCSGLRFRVVGSRIHEEVFGAFGFDPIHIDVRDLPEAAGTGLIDGQENPLANTVNLGVHRFQRYHSLTHHFFGPMLILANRPTFDALPAAAREELKLALGHATAFQRKLAAEADQAAHRQLLESGCHIVERHEVDIGSFSEAAAPIRNRELSAISPEIRRAFEA